MGAVGHSVKSARLKPGPLDKCPTTFMKGAVVLFWGLGAPGWSDTSESTVKVFYQDYFRHFAQRQKSPAPSAALMNFLQQHEKQLTPSLYQLLVKVEQPWVLYEKKQGPFPGLIAEHDYLSGSAGDYLKGLSVGKARQGRVPVSFSSNDMQGNPVHFELTVVIQEGRIADLIYPKTGSRLTQELTEALKVRRP